MVQTQSLSIAVVGIGNILLGDEGIGVHVVEFLRQRELPLFVSLVDGGTAGADLLDVFADRDLLIVVDAVSGNYPPGTVLRMSPEDTAARDVSSLSLHEVGVIETLEMAQLLRCAPKKVVFFGVKPKDISCRIGLSPELECIVEKLGTLIQKEIAHNTR